jgi:hypothetical protein
MFWACFQPYCRGEKVLRHRGAIDLGKQRRHFEINAGVQWTLEERSQS